MRSLESFSRFVNDVLKPTAALCAVAGCVALGGCRQSGFPRFPRPFARDPQPKSADTAEAKTLTPWSKSPFKRSKSDTFGFSDRAREIERSLGME